MDRNEAKPGTTLHAVIGLRNYRGEPSTIPVSVPIPADLRASEVQLFVGDADAALRMDEPPPRAAANAGSGAGPPAPDPFASEHLREAAGNRARRGRGRKKSSRPAAVGHRRSLNRPTPACRQATLHRITLWETNFPVAGTFSGQMTLPVRIK